MFQGTRASCSPRIPARTRLVGRAPSEIIFTSNFLLGCRLAFTRRGEVNRPVVRYTARIAISDCTCADAFYYLATFQLTRVRFQIERKFSPQIWKLIQDTCPNAEIPLTFSRIFQGNIVNLFKNTFLAYLDTFNFPFFNLDIVDKIE